MTGGVPANLENLEMLIPEQTTCWVVTDGKAGMENQCLGLAEAIGLAPQIKRVKLRSPWKELSPFLRHGLAWAHSAKSDAIEPPWPDLLIATGRASIPASLYARRASRIQGVPKTLTVQLQNPVIPSTRFDLVVTPRHDGLTGANVMTTRGALHRITDKMLRDEAEKLLPLVEHLPSPRIAVLVGGSNAVYQLTPREMAPVTMQLADMAKNTGGSLMITPSRRTGEANLLVLQAGLNDVPSYIWDGAGYNPYYGMLALADYIVVTCDSVNMASEACTTGKPVYVVDLPGGSDKFRRFHQSLRDDGLARSFNGQLDHWNYAPLNDVQLVAQKIRGMLEDRRKTLAALGVG